MLPNPLQRCVMQTEPVLDQAELDARLAALEDSIEAINTRIARLAIALKVSLDTPDHVQQVIDRSAMPKDVVSPFAPDATVTGQIPGDGEFALADRRTDANRRKAFEWEELRGLLILRFEIEKIMSSSLACRPRGKLFRSPKTTNCARGLPPTPMVWMLPS